MLAAKVASRTGPGRNEGADASSARQPEACTEPACAPNGFPLTEGRRAPKAEWKSLGCTRRR
jgi:hypothetical protein